jgi:hypothetical protein
MELNFILHSWQLESFNIHIKWEGNPPLSENSWGSVFFQTSSYFHSIKVPPLSIHFHFDNFTLLLAL